MVAETYADQLRHFHTNDTLQITGQWAEPYTSASLYQMKNCFEYGTLYADIDGIIQCSAPGCNSFDPADSSRKRWWEFSVR
jgi:hypothetical protein